MCCAPVPVNQVAGLAQGLGHPHAGPRRAACAACRTGFEDHVSYGCADYRRTVATVLQQIAADPALLTDDRRVEVELVHV